MHNFLRAIHHVLILSSCPVHFTFLLLFLTAHFKCWPSWAVSMFLTLAVCVMNSRLPLNLSRLVNRGTWIGGVVYNSQITMPKASILHYYFYHICISRLQNHYSVQRFDISPSIHSKQRYTDDGWKIAVKKSTFHRWFVQLFCSLHSPPPLPKKESRTKLLIQLFSK